MALSDGLGNVRQMFAPQILRLFAAGKIPEKLKISTLGGNGSDTGMRETKWQARQRAVSTRSLEMMVVAMSRPD